MFESRSINYPREAFLHPLNIGFLMAVSLLALLFSGTSWMPTLIITIGLGLELLYLGTVPWKPWFRHHIATRSDTVAKQPGRSDRDKELFDRLDVAGQKRFLALRRLHDKIEANFNRMPGSSRVMTHSLISRLDALISEYLQHLVLQERLSEYLRNASTGALIIEIRSLEKEMATVQNKRLYEVRNRRLDILKKRLEKLKAAGEKADLYYSQQQTIEDAIQYVYEKSLTMYDPEDIDLQLDEMMGELEETSAYIMQLEDDAVLLSRFDRYVNT